MGHVGRQTGPGLRPVGFTRSCRTPRTDTARSRYYDQSNTSLHWPTGLDRTAICISHTAGRLGFIPAVCRQSQAAIAIGNLLHNRQAGGLVGFDDATEKITADDGDITLEALVQQLATRTYTG